MKKTIKDFKIGQIWLDMGRELKLKAIVDDQDECLVFSDSDGHTCTRYIDETHSWELKKEAA